MPFDPKTATQAAKLGQPFAKTTKSTKVSQPLTQLLEQTLAQGEEAEEQAASTSLLGKLGGLKALVAKKPAANAA